MIIDKLRQEAEIDVAEIHQSEWLIIDVREKSADNTINLDTAIRLKINTETEAYLLFEVQRDEEYLLAECKTKRMGELALYVTVKRCFGKDKPSNEVKKYLRSLGDRIDVADKYLEKEIGSQYYSLDSLEMGKVNLIGNSNGDFDVIYINEVDKTMDIVVDRGMPSALVVVYNYSFYLKQFMEKLIPQLVVYSLTGRELDELKMLYLKK